MAKASIGELNVKLSADSKGFAATLAQAEKQLTAFAAKAASPATFALGGLTGLTAAVGGPIGILTGAIGHLTDAIPGLEKFSFFFDPKRYSAAMQEVKDSTVELARSADLLDFEPQFLKALQLTAGPLADQLTPALLRLEAFQAHLRQGGEGMLEGGQRRVIDIAQAYGMDPEKIANMTKQEFVLEFADQMKKAKEAGDELGMAWDILGGRGAKLANVFSQGSEGIQKWLDLVKESGVGSPELVAATNAGKMLDKLLTLEKEGVKAREYLRHGVISDFYKAKAEMAPVLSDDWFKYTSLYLSSLAPTLGVPLKMPKELQDKIDAIKPLAEPTETKFGLVEAMKEWNAAQDALEGVNKALDDQQQLLELTEAGWVGVEREVKALSEAVAAGGDVNRALEILERLAGVAKGNVAKKAADEQEKAIRQAIGGFKSPAEFAPVALAGSAEAAAAVNRQFAGTGVADLLPTAEQIRDAVKRQESRTEGIDNLIRDVRGLLSGGEIGPA